MDGPVARVSIPSADGWRRSSFQKTVSMRVRCLICGSSGPERPPPMMRVRVAIMLPPGAVMARAVPVGQ